MKKKLIAGILSISMLACLASCSGGTEETSAPSADNTASSETTQAASEETTAVETEAVETEAEETEARVVDYSDLLSGYDRFELTTTDLTDGVWDDVISNTGAGENASPALSWEPVEGASLYVIYMVDRDASFWIHWKSNDVTETELPRGWATDDYVGPYPPEGSEHTYDIYVIALKAPVESLKGGLDNASPNFPDLIIKTDTDADGNTGNIIAYGQVSGTFTGK